jgi:DNA-binding HxlR family transcriptional regulator
MKGYGQFCPVAKTAEIFAQRWTPLILRELCFGPQGFNDLRRAMPLVARSVLSQRLSALTFGGVIVADKKPGIGSQYRLTPAGEAFRPLIQLMSKWGQTWGQGNISPTDLDPALLVWGLRRQIHPSLVPASVFVIQFEFSGLRKSKKNQRYWWLVFRKPHVEVCMKNPGYVVDVKIAADLETFSRVWLGYEGLRGASDMVSFAGSREAVKLARQLLDIRDTPTEKTFLYLPKN